MKHRIKFVKQLTPSSCGIAVVASLANKSHTEIKKLYIKLIWNNKDPKNYYSYLTQMVKVLKNLKIKSALNHTTSNNWNDLPDVAVARILYKNGCGHFCIFFRDENNRKYLYDPYLNKIRKDFYRLNLTHYLPIYL